MSDENPNTEAAVESPVTTEEVVVLSDTTSGEEENEPARSTVPVGSQLLIAVCILSALFGVSYLPWLNTRSEAPHTLEQALRDKVEHTIEERATATSVPEPKVEATAAFIWDIRHQRALFNKNASAQLPLASLTKLMTSLVALETLGEDAKVPMTLEAIYQDGPSDFADGELFEAKALSDFSLVSSSNDGAYALAAAAGAVLSGGAGSTSAFVTAMNKRAEELGLTQTYFANPTGLDESSSESGSYGSARDMAFLMEYLIKKRPEIVLGSTKKYTKVTGVAPHTATNTNDIVDRIPGLLATKTGYTDLAGGNLAIAFDAGLDRPIALVVLGSSREGRFRDMRTLIAYTQEKITEAEEAR
jgi:D-alanyl-D-alanine carboxypeptidase (penicillin-binding protein 5/6)